MYEDYENLGYLAHHGILGMKWGKQNGPPYPLSDAKHDRVIQRAEKKRIRREKRAEKRKQNILKDPKKIVKYQNEFSKEEIESAIDKIDTVNKVKTRIPESNLQKKIKKVRLSKKKKRWASTPSELEKNAHKFTNEEMQEALQYLKNTENIFDLKVKRARRPLEIGNTVSDYVGSMGRLLGNWNTLRDNSVKTRGAGLTNDERHKIWLKENISPEYFEMLVKGGKKKK